MDVDVKALVQASIQTKIIEAFNETPEAIDQLVQAALKKEVDEHGNEPRYNSNKRMPYLEYLVGENIRNFATKAVLEAVRAREDDVCSAVKKALSTDDVVVAFAKSIVDATAKNWAIDVIFRESSED